MRRKYCNLENSKQETLHCLCHAILSPQSTLQANDSTKISTFVL